MTELDEVLRGLSEIQDQLLALPDDAFAEKYRLQQRQQELRALATKFARDWEGDRSTEDLMRELKALRHRLADLERMRLDLVSQAGGGGEEGFGAAGGGGVELNTAISRAQGIGEVQARIGRIKGILEDRGVDAPE